MKRNSTDVFIESPNATTPIPWVNGAPDFSGIEEPTLSVLQKAWQDFLASGQSLEVIPDLIPEPPVIKPDWDGLVAYVLGGALYPIYARLTQASFANPITATIQDLVNANNIAVAAGKLNQSVQVTRVESAVAASFQSLITTSTYRFTQEEKDLWNSLVESLNFSPLVYLP